MNQTGPVNRKLKELRKELNSYYEKLEYLIDYREEIRELEEEANKNGVIKVIKKF